MFSSRSFLFWNTTQDIWKGSVHFFKLQVSEWDLWSPCFKFSKIDLIFEFFEIYLSWTKYIKNAFRSHNIYVTQTILDETHTNICSLKWMTKSYDSVDKPTHMILENWKVGKNQYFEMSQTHPYL